MVASIIVGLLTFEIWSLVRAGSKFYVRVRGQGEIQRNSLMALRWITKDLGEGSAVSFREYTTDGGEGQANNVSRPGISFGSPTDANGAVSYDPDGRLLWKSVVGYYIESNDGTLYRQVLELDSPQTYAPTIDNDKHSPDEFADMPRPRVIARHIDSIDTTQGPSDILVKLVSKNEDLGYGITVQTRLEMKN